MPDQQPTIEQRDLHFSLDDSDVIRWHGAGPHVSLFFNALSPFFPEGEKFFIRSVRALADKTDKATLKRDIQGFIGQEAMHGREHRVYNERLSAAGLPADKVERFVRNDLKVVEKIFSPNAKLALTCALEHLTAIMANALLSHQSALADSDPAMSSLWRWHAVEETEHKAVAFDLYQEAVPGLWGYLLRCNMMLITAVLFSLEIFVVHLIFCKRAGVVGDLRGWMNLFHFMWIRPGLRRKLLRPWLAWFKPGFHPWQDDNRHHIEKWKAQHAA